MELQRVGLAIAEQIPKAAREGKTEGDRETAVGPNDVWAMDLVHDQFATGRKLRILTIVDTHSRYAPGD